MVWGLAIPSKSFQSFLDGAFSYDFHEYLSLLGLGFVFVHVAVLMLDKYLPFSLIQVVVPFIDTYRPFWVGLGIISFYVLLLVTVTFYIRQWIGVKAFRAVHILSLFGYLGATLHGLFAGTDSALPITKFLYTGTFLVTFFMTAYWLVRRKLSSGDSQSAVTRVGAR
jgi:predicted ferric reductase